MEEKNEMEICPACGVTIEPGSDECSSCGLSFATESVLEPVMERESNELITLFKLNDSIEANLIKLMLEDSGIPCEVSTGGMTSVFGVSTAIGFSFTKVKILVPKSRAKDAVKVLAERKKWSENELQRYLSMLDDVE